MLHVFFRIPHGRCYQRPGGPTNQRRLLNESININTQTEAGGSTQLKLLLIRVTLWPPLIRDADRGSGCAVILSFKSRASGWEDPSRGKREIKTAETRGKFSIKTYRQILKLRLDIWEKKKPVRSLSSNIGCDLLLFIIRESSRGCGFFSNMFNVSFVRKKSQLISSL